MSMGTVSHSAVSAYLLQIAALPAVAVRPAFEMFYTGIDGPLRWEMSSLLDVYYPDELSGRLRELHDAPQPLEARFISPIVPDRIDEYIRGCGSGEPCMPRWLRAPGDVSKLMRFYSMEWREARSVFSFFREQEDDWDDNILTAADRRRRTKGVPNHRRMQRLAGELAAFEDIIYPKRSKRKFDRIGTRVRRWRELRDSYDIPISDEVMWRLLRDADMVGSMSIMREEKIDLSCPRVRRQVRRRLRETPLWYRDMLFFTFHHDHSKGSDLGYVLKMARLAGGVSDRKLRANGFLNSWIINKWERGKGMTHEHLRLASILYRGPYRRLLPCYHQTYNLDLEPYLEKLKFYRPYVYLSGKVFEVRRLKEYAKRPGTLGERVLFAQLSLDFMQREMSAAMGLPKSVYCHLVGNKNYPGRKVFEAVPRVLGISMRELLLLGLETYYPELWDSKRNEPLIKAYGKMPFWVHSNVWLDPLKLRSFVKNPGNYAEVQYCARRYRGFALDDLAVRVGIDEQVLKDFENMKSNPTYEQTSKIARVLGQPTEEFTRAAARGIIAPQ